MSNQVAQTILAQLGGRQFLAMTGASNLLAGEFSLSMKVGRNSKAVTHVKITLNSDDTYTVCAMSIRGFNEPKIKGQRSGVYCDMLQEIFTDLTGLYTHL